MNKRQPLSKKIRFEVFKRDKFTCQYCGRKAPEVILHIDHIDPVAKGGGNEVTNLITSCFDCNNGKRDKKLDDNSVVEKQRRQLELLQERREQIELMLEWKKSLATFDDDVRDMIVEYIESKIKPNTLNENGKRSVADLLKKFSTEKILDGIDEAAKKYLKYSNNKLQKESIELFFSKIGGVIAVKEMPPIKQKLIYIKGIARNRFGYWDDRKGSIILNNYVTALQNYGWDEKNILSDIEKEIIPLTKESPNWGYWKNSLEKWTEDVKNWKSNNKNKQEEAVSEKKEGTYEQLELGARYEHDWFVDKVKALIYIGKVFTSFNKENFKIDIVHQMLAFISKMEGIYKEKNDLKNTLNRKDYLLNFIEYGGLLSHFNAPDEDPNFGQLMVFEGVCYDLLQDVFSDLFYPDTNYSENEVKILLKIHRDFYEKMYEGLKKPNSDIEV